jgi:hypothetical protein
VERLEKTTKNLKIARRGLKPGPPDIGILQSLEKLEYRNGMSPINKLEQDVCRIGLTTSSMEDTDS